MALLGANVWRRMLGVDRATVIEEVDVDERPTRWSFTCGREAPPSAAAALRGACAGL